MSRRPSLVATLVLAVIFSFVLLGVTYSILWPRLTYNPVVSVDHVVGHSDSAAHPTQFILTHYKALYYLLEVRGGDTNNVHVYAIAVKPASTIQPTITFDTQGDVFVTISNSTYVLRNLGQNYALPVRQPNSR